MVPMRRKINKRITLKRNIGFIITCFPTIGETRQSTDLFLNLSFCTRSDLYQLYPDWTSVNVMMIPPSPRPRTIDTNCAGEWIFVLPQPFETLDRLFHSHPLRLWKRATSRQERQVACRLLSVSIMLDISRGHYAWEWTTLDTNMSLLSEP